MKKTQQTIETLMSSLPEVGLSEQGALVGGFSILPSRNANAAQQKGILNGLCFPGANTQCTADCGPNPRDPRNGY